MVSSSVWTGAILPPVRYYSGIPRSPVTVLDTDHSPVISRINHLTAKTTVRKIIVNETNILASFCRELSAPSLTVGYF